MHGPVGQNRRRANPANDSAPTHITQLVRLLIELVDEESTPESTPKQKMCGEEIILDTQVDGFRYLLVRLPESEQPHIRLSPREQEIVRMVALGHPNKVIADVLNISPWTVCTHLRRIFAKLGVGSRAAMVAHLLEISRATGAVQYEVHPDQPKPSRTRSDDTRSPELPSSSEWKNQSKVLSRRIG